MEEKCGAIDTTLRTVVRMNPRLGVTMLAKVWLTIYSGFLGPLDAF